jgi:hypothetical protein
VSGAESKTVRQPLEYLAKLPRLLHELLSFDRRQKSLYEYLGRARGTSAPAGEVVLVQCVEDPFYFGLFGRIATSLRERQPVRVEQFVLRSVIPGESGSFWLFLKTRLITSPLAGRKWVRLYGSFCDGIAYRSTSFHPIADAVDLCRAWVCWRNLKDRKALLDVTIDGIAVGDLVNDSYLRFKPAPSVELKNIYLWIVLWQAYRDVRRAKRYFSRGRPKLYLTSYSTYIHHGIAVRVALQSGTRVFSFGNYQEFAKELSAADLVHTKNPDDYASGFARLEGPEDRLAQAEAALVARMAGVIDSATAYMRKSAYEESKDPVPDVRGALVVFLHDFYDSPHVYRGVVFPDFWEWTCFTIETLKAANIRFFLKPHPNQVVLNDDVLVELKHRYPDISIISSNITNKQLAEAGLACAVTVYGTIAHEMAYLGIPTIACAHHPHVNFDFCRTASSREEHAEFLRHFSEAGVDRSKMRRQALIFYYMHNLNLPEEERTLRSLVSELRRASAEPSAAGEELPRLLGQMRELMAFKSHIAGWANNLAR